MHRCPAVGPIVFEHGNPVRNAERWNGRVDIGRESGHMQALPESGSTKGGGTMIPPGLPELPPVPEGFERWEYRGMGISGLRNYAYLCDEYDEIKWKVLSGKLPSIGIAQYHYLEAITSPQVDAPETAVSLLLKAAESAKAGQHDEADKLIEAARVEIEAAEPAGTPDTDAVEATEQRIWEDYYHAMVDHARTLELSRNAERAEKREWQRRAEAATKALSAILDRYTGLVNSGDAGNWDSETEPEVIAARAALHPDAKP